MLRAVVSSVGLTFTCAGGLSFAPAFSAADLRRLGTAVGTPPAVVFSAGLAFARAAGLYAAHVVTIAGLRRLGGLCPPPAVVSSLIFRHMRMRLVSALRKSPPVVVADSLMLLMASCSRCSFSAESTQSISALVPRPSPTL